MKPQRKATEMTTRPGHPPLTLELGQASPHVIHGHLKELVRDFRGPGLEQVL